MTVIGGPRSPVHVRAQPARARARKGPLGEFAEALRQLPRSQNIYKGGELIEMATPSRLPRVADNGEEEEGRRGPPPPANAAAAPAAAAAPTPVDAAAAAAAATESPAVLEALKSVLPP